MRKFVNTFFDVEDTVESLVKRYYHYGSLILAVDFDETIHNSYSDPKKDFTPVHELIREAAKLNFQIVIYTARNEKHFGFIEEFCKEHDLPFTHPVNKEVCELPEPTCGKIYYNIFLDDKAGLGQAAEILYKVIERLQANDK